MRKYVFIVLGTLALHALQAQELNVNVKINTLKLQTADPRIFQTLEGAIMEFMNNQKWTDDEFEPEERINANLVLTIQEEISVTSFKAELAVQASRPVYGAEYETPLFNHIDKNVTFTYEQYQPLQFSKNRYNDNLSSILAFYAHMILGYDYDSFSPFGGDSYFQAAQDIVNNVPEGEAEVYPGWRPLNSNNRNRYWLAENMLSPRVRPFRQAWYDYHRQGLDVASSNFTTGRAVIAACMDQLQLVDKDYPNSMIIQVFTDTKSQEIVDIFTNGTIQEQNKVIQIMSRLDAVNAAKYRGMK
ncbi:MAG TPA: DUF4835 family protein [Saprospiraceae bacterium]|nr:DUF4835 family protein [Saprospiraceae bacterium]HMQ83701.1 DUF4835 family protein [Saprospiraceae bacterium]